MWKTAALLLVGCNGLYGIEKTGAVDAQYFDAPIDAPFSCPPVGETPQFGQSLVQVLFQPVAEYTTSPTTGRAFAFSGGLVLEGPIDSPMLPAAGFTFDPQCLSCPYLRNPRLTPEGDALFGVVQAQVSSTLVKYTFNGTTWEQAVNYGPGPMWMSSVSRGPKRRFVAREYSGVYREFEIDDTKVTEIGMYTQSDLGAPQLGVPMLTADGLRMVFVAYDYDTTATSHYYYTDRTSLDSRFTAARELVGVPAIDGAYMLEDCSRIYLSGLGSLFYAPRR